MKIATVVITCNRLPLLLRALTSIEKQNRKPDFVFVVSNSTDENFEVEEKMCANFGFSFAKNTRTASYTGALNTSIEKIIALWGINSDIYFASLNDDDEWLPNYLQEIESNNTRDFDLLIGSLLRKSEQENELQTLPEELSEYDFLIGNPGVCGSNTFVRLITLLKAGCFDEGLPATADRDFFVRVFQQKPTYKIINKHLVTQYTENNRPKITTNLAKKKHSLQIFFYKYQYLMNDTTKEKFFARANTLFATSRAEIEQIKTNITNVAKQDIQFVNKGNYQFIIGFIAGNAVIAERIAIQIVEKNIPIDLVLIVDNVPKSEYLTSCQNILKSKNIPYKIINPQTWKEHLANGYYGLYFKHFSEINSIPLGRTILHHHLFTETSQMQQPVYWIIDDDISFSTTVFDHEKNKELDLFEIINDHYKNVDALIGSISNDPPVPTLCCIRGQLVDFLHSHYANNLVNADYLNLRLKSDYYYDLSDIHSDHLEIPIYHTKAKEEELELIFSGKSVSRQALQKELKAVAKIITKRGANTLVFNRELLRSYPVINIEVNNKFARRGDLLWALLNQVVSNKEILEHTFSIDHNRTINDFILDKELDKAAYDIIGYAFNKGFLDLVHEVKKQTISQNPKDIFEQLNHHNYYQLFIKSYTYFLEKRKIRFLMNYYRIIGLTQLLARDFVIAKQVYNQLVDTKALNTFYSILADAQDDKTLKSFFNQFLSVLNSSSIPSVYTKTCQIFTNKIQEATQEIENYTDKICNSAYSFTLECSNGGGCKPSQFLFTTSTGLFLYDETKGIYTKLLDGKYYGLTKYGDTWIATRSNNKGDRNHITNNRISDICAFNISINNKIENLRVLLYGIPGEIHQIDIAKNYLYIPHTDFNQVLFINIDTCLNSLVPKSILDCDSYELDIYAHSHLNSVFVSNNILYLIAHNFTMKTNKMSDLILFDLSSNKLDSIIPLNAHSAHNILVDGLDYFFCDSNNKTLYKNKLPLFNSDKLLRGLSITDDYIFVGGSDICFDNYKRFSNNPSIYILDKKTSTHLKTIHFSGLGDMYEIRQVNYTDYSLSKR